MATKFSRSILLEMDLWQKVLSSSATKNQSAVGICLGKHLSIDFRQACISNTNQFGITALLRAGDIKVSIWIRISFHLFPPHINWCSTGAERRRKHKVAQRGKFVKVHLPAFRSLSHQWHRHLRHLNLHQMLQE